MYWTEAVLSYLIPLLIVCCVIWIGFTILDGMRNRAFNLTTSETVGGSSSDRPDFLKVDHEKREAALRGGEAFDAHVQKRDASSEAVSSSARTGIAGKCTVLLAILSLVTGAIGALMRVEAYDNAVRKFGIWDNVVETVSNHPVGFVVAMAVIAVAAFNVFRAIHKGSA